MFNPLAQPMSHSVFLYTNFLVIVQFLQSLLLQQ